MPARKRVNSSGTTLAIETSCDETSVALVRQGAILVSLVSSQVSIHAEYGGVVPELATREHLRNLPPLVQTACARADCPPAALSAIAATQGPGLPNALMIGLKTAQGLAFALERPFYGIHHHEAHLYSAWIDGTPPRADLDILPPHVSLIVSGGHTLLVHVPSPLHHIVLGSTLDDAAGECFDKTAKLLGLPYPGGPVIDQLAEGGQPDAFDFPRPLRDDATLDFSFSGLKTAVRYFLRDHPDLTADPSALRDLCASVQAAIVDVLVTKTVRAARRRAVRCITASGGVVGNRLLRRELAAAADRLGCTLRLAAGPFCSDNAAMVAILADHLWRHGAPATDCDAEPRPGWDLSDVRPTSPATARSARADPGPSGCSPCSSRS